MVRLGQNFLADPNLLDAIVRESGLEANDVVLEVGGGEGVLTERLAAEVATLHVIELDERLRPGLEELAAREPAVRPVFGDAMDVDLAALVPAPLPSLRTWTVMVQREIADRLRASPRTKAYGSPSVLVQLACRVELLRAVDPAVFRPRPRVGSALLRLERMAPWPGDEVARLVRGAFAHRRKALARSVGISGVASRERTLAALEAAGLPGTARAEELAPPDFVRLAEALADPAGPGRAAEGADGP